MLITNEAPTCRSVNRSTVCKLRIERLNMTGNICHIFSAGSDNIPPRCFSQIPPEVSHCVVKINICSTGYAQMDYSYEVTRIKKKRLITTVMISVAA